MRNLAVLFERAVAGEAAQQHIEHRGEQKAEERDAEHSGEQVAGLDAALKDGLTAEAYLSLPDSEMRALTRALGDTPEGREVLASIEREIGALA